MAASVTKELRPVAALLGAERSVFIPQGPQIGIAAVAKRLIDLLGALVALILLAPLMLAIAIAVESGWPVIFSQRRLGQNGTQFTVFKFRSMACDAERRLEDVKHDNHIKDGPTFKCEEDPRVMKVGRVLRRASLDELPQLWNVLWGNMSLVGPRPPLESEVLEYEPWQLARLAGKPGMTGLWQVSGRSDLSFTEMVALDVAYLEGWSVLSDVMLLLRTPVAVLTARGAY